MGDEGLEPPKRSRAAELQSAPFAARVNHPAVWSARSRARHVSSCSSPGAAVLETIQQRQELRSQGRALRLVGVGEAEHDGRPNISVPAIRQDHSSTIVDTLCSLSIAPALASTDPGAPAAAPRGAGKGGRGGRPRARCDGGEEGDEGRVDARPLVAPSTDRAAGRTPWFRGVDDRGAAARGGAAEGRRGISRAWQGRAAGGRRRPAWRRCSRRRGW